uniref:REPA_OB_2 domain-containing protein n=1 Tax=Parastrongyloides trichosuri TaxID=131310 RepID=A0A0N4Z7G0_PARTI
MAEQPTSDTNFLTKNYFGILFEEFSKENPQYPEGDIVIYSTPRALNFDNGLFTCCDHNSKYNYCIIDDYPPGLYKSLQSNQRPIIKVKEVQIYKKYNMGEVKYIIRIVNCSLINPHCKLTFKEYKSLEIENPYLQPERMAYILPDDPLVPNKDNLSRLIDIRPEESTGVYIVQITDITKFVESKKSLESRTVDGVPRDAQNAIYTFAFTVLDNFGGETKIIGFNQFNDFLYKDLHLGQFYLLQLDDAKTHSTAPLSMTISDENKKRPVYKNKTNTIYNLIIGPGLKLSCLSPEYAFKYPKLSCPLIEFAKIDNLFRTNDQLLNDTVNVIGCIARVEPITSFYNKEFQKYSIKRIIYLVDNNKKVITVSIFGYRCFEFNVVDVRNVLIISSLNVKKYITNIDTIIGLTVTANTKYLNQPSGEILNLQKETEKIDFDSLNYPSILNEETPESILSKTRSLGALLKNTQTGFETTRFYFYVRVFSWGDIKIPNIPEHKILTDNEMFKLGSKLYTKITIYDCSHNLSGVSIFCNKLAKLLHMDENEIIKMYVENKVGLYELLDTYKVRVLRIKLAISEKVSGDKVYRNYNIDDVMLADMEEYGKLLRDANNFLENFKRK